MSRTDAHRPDWVQLQDPKFKYGVVEFHFHRTGHACDLEPHLPAPRRNGGWTWCNLWPKYSDTGKLLGRPRFRRSFKSFQDGRARADLRRLRAKWLREPIRKDIDSTENLPTSRWRWRRWYWD